MKTVPAARLSTAPYGFWNLDFGFWGGLRLVVTRVSASAGHGGDVVVPEAYRGMAAGVLTLASPAK
ncbi:MAG: hypothetical protein WBO97_00305 [Tepidiformaceae bacterium]